MIPEYLQSSTFRLDTCDGKLSKWEGYSGTPASSKHGMILTNLQSLSRWACTGGRLCENTMPQLCETTNATLNQQNLHALVLREVNNKGAGQLFTWDATTTMSRQLPFPVILSIQDYLHATMRRVSRTCKRQFCTWEDHATKSDFLNRCRRSYML
jgi:hypothetical protein